MLMCTVQKWHTSPRRISLRRAICLAKINHMLAAGLRMLEATHMYRSSLTLAFVVLYSAAGAASDLSSVYVAPGGVYVASGNVFAARALWAAGAGCWCARRGLCAAALWCTASLGLCGAAAGLWSAADIGLCRGTAGLRGARAHLRADRRLRRRLSAASTGPHPLWRPPALVIFTERARQQRRRVQLHMRERFSAQPILRSGQPTKPRPRGANRCRRCQGIRP